MSQPKICCPKCGRSFDNEVQVQQHCDQPRLRCNQPSVQLVDPQELLHHFKHRRVDAPSPQIVFPHRAVHVVHDSASEEASDDTRSDSNSKSDGTDNTFVGPGPTDYFEGAAKVFDHNG